MAHSKQNKLVESTASSSSCPQKSYKGQAESTKRRILRDHLFSGRLITLSKLYTGKPLPLFEKSNRLVKVTVDFFGNEFVLLLSLEDKWTEFWIKKLKKFSAPLEHQFNILNTVGGAIFGALGFGGVLSSVISTFIKNLSGSLISCVLAIGILMKSTDSFISCQAMTLLITNLGVSAVTLMNLSWPLIPAAMIFQSDALAFQANETQPFSWVPSAIAVLLTIIMGGATAGQYVGLFTKTASMGYTLGSIACLQRITTEAMRELVPFVYKMITGRDWHLERLTTSMTQFSDFITSMETFEREKLPELNINWEYQQEVFVLNKKYKDLILEATRLGLLRELTPLVANHYRKLEDWMKRVAASGILLAGNRVEPVSIVFSGKPASGKSAGIMKFVHDVASDLVNWGTIPNETITNHIYCRNPQEEYWSGYRGQFCTLYDDLGQVSDTESKPNPEFMEVIQAYGDNAYRLKMASLEDKERAYFRSRLLVATTNLQSFSSTILKSIREPDAFARRWDLFIEVERKDDKQEYHLHLDGQRATKVDWVTMVNLVRSLLRAKQEKFLKRMEAGAARESSVEHKCVAKAIRYVSAPSHILGTAIKREAYDERTPNHSYCHPSLSCRMEHQGWLEWVLGRKEKHLVNVTVLDLLWDPRLAAFVTITDIDTTRLDDITRRYCEGLDPELARQVIEKDEQFMQNGIRFHPTEHISTKVDDLTFQFTLDATTIDRKTIVQGMLHSNREDLAFATHISVELLLETWSDTCFRAALRCLRACTGLFATIADALLNFLMEHPFAIAPILYGLAKLPEMIREAVSQRHNPTEPVDNLNAKINEVYKKTQPRTSHQSRDMTGAQKSNKFKTNHMTRESRDMLGAQKSNKIQTLKMLHEDIGPRECLEIKRLGTFEWVTIREDVMRSLFEKGTKYADLVRLCSHYYIELLIEAVKDGGQGDEEVHRAMVRLYRDCETRWGRQSVLEALDTPQEVMEVISDVDAQTFEKFLAKKAPKLNHQGSADQNADGISKAIKNNIYDIKAKGAVARASQIFFYKARTAWCNRHTYHRLAKMDFSIVRYRSDNSQEEYTFRWDDCKVVIHPDLDIVVIQFPKTLSPQPAVFKHIIKDSELDFKILPAARLLTRREGEIIYMQTPHPFVIEKATVEVGEVVPACSSIGYTGMNTVAGDCGAPLLALDPTRQRKICGLHFLGNAHGAGQAVIVTQELLESMETFGELRDDMEYQINMGMDIPETDILMPIGTVATPFEPTKTKIRWSSIHGEVTAPITRPSILKVTPDLDPMKRALLRMQRPRVIVNDSFIAEAQQVLTRYTSGVVTIARTLTLDEALHAKNIEGLEPIDIGTSAGLPLCMDPQAFGKRKWISEERVPTDEFRRAHEEFIAQLVEGDLSDIPIFKETLKDERVKLAKADITQPDKVKTRLFSASPLHLLVALRRYYGAFVAHTVRNKIRNTCTSGVNPHGADWQMIADWLHEVSDKVDDGDYQDFDISEPSGFLIATYNAIREWYKMNGGNSHDDKIRERLAELCYHPFRSARGVVHRTNGSLPSGMFGTTTINSGSNLTAFFYAFKVLYPDASAQDFLSNVRTVTHGDDVLFSVSPNYPAFTSENIGHALKNVNMVFTPADKSGIASQARPLEENTFLKRGFKKIHGIYRAPLDRQSSLEMCNWVTKSSDPVKATIDNCEAALRELAISEDDEVWQRKIRDALYKKTQGRVNLVIPSQEEAIAANLKHF